MIIFKEKGKDIAIYVGDDADNSKGEIAALLMEIFGKWKFCPDEALTSAYLESDELRQIADKLDELNNG